MSDDIRIRAEVMPNQISCKFTIDRPVFPKGFARILNKEQAKGAPLAERLFSISGVTSVDIGEDFVLVTKSSSDDWRQVGPAIGKAIREQLSSGQAAVSAEKVAQLPAADQLRAKVQKILDEQINPAVASHGGYITLVDVQGSDIFIQMGGGCQGCSAADVTLRDGVEQALRQQIPELGNIVDASDHAAGENPYYASR